MTDISQNNIYMYVLMLIFIHSKCFIYIYIYISSLFVEEKTQSFIFIS